MLTYSLLLIVPQMFTSETILPYTEGKTTIHNGDANTKALLQLLDGQDFFSQYAKVSVHGVSAGAIGALHHMHNIAPLFSNIVDKTLLLEGIGLHFGSRFWHKFPAEYIQDFRASLQNYNTILDINDGNISSLVPAVCNLFSDWHVGTIQGSRDITMSMVFGNISPGDHQRLVYGNTGLWNHTLAANDNCSSFIPNTFKHTFLKRENKWNVNANGHLSRERLSVIKYAKRVIFERESDNFK